MFECYAELPLLEYAGYSSFYFLQIFLSALPIVTVDASTAVTARSLYHADRLVRSFREVLVCVGAVLCTII